MPGGRAHLPPEPGQEDPRVRLLHGEPTAEGPSPGWGTPGPSQPQNPASRARSLPVSTRHDPGNIGGGREPLLAPRGLCAVPAPKAWPGHCPPALRGCQRCVGARMPASPFTTLPAGSQGTQSWLSVTTWREGVGWGGRWVGYSGGMGHTYACGQFTLMYGKTHHNIVFILQLK